MRGSRDSIPRSGQEHLWIVPLVKAMSVESDRGAILVASACIDERLASILHSRFERDSGPNTELFHWLLWNDPSPPLGSTGVKARLCLALGLIDKDICTAINKVSKIRNDFFAHFAQPASFNKPAIKKILNDTFALLGWDAEASKEFRKRNIPKNKRRWNASRAMFTHLVASLVIMLIVAELKITNRPSVSSLHAQKKQKQRKLNVRPR
jgi:hypothetical protein